MGRVAVIQMTSSPQVNDNLQGLEVFFKQAREQGVELLVLPENMAFMGLCETDKWRVAEIYGQGDIQSTLRQLSKTYGIWVIAGTIPIRSSGERVYASCLIYDDRGDCVARYDKIHLFDVQVSEKERYLESSAIEPGHATVVVPTPVGCVGLSICYDLRFPELYRQLVEQGAEILAVPSAFTATTGAAHWEVLLRARAIENVSYVLAANQSGMHANGRTTHGHSMIVGPWGQILAVCADGPGMVVSEIDLQGLRLLRQQFPCNEHHVL